MADKAAKKEVGSGEQEGKAKALGLALETIEKTGTLRPQDL